MGKGERPVNVLSRDGVALLVVDIQNDYCAPGGAFDRAGHDLTTAREMLPTVARLIGEARQRGSTVVFVQNTVDPEGRMRSALQRRRRQNTAGTADYVIDGTWGHRFAEPLEVAEGDLLMKKYASSAFVGTPLDQTLRAAGVNTVVVTGVVTWGCVMATAQSAAQTYIPVVVSDCVAGYDEYLHEAALEMMRRGLGADLVISSSQVLERWPDFVTL
jgi:nicotinamidase-related amidase